MPENQLLQNVHLPCCRYTHQVNFIPSLRTIDYSPFCYRRYLGMSVKQMWSQPLVSWIYNSTKRFRILNWAYQHDPELFKNFKRVVEGAANTSGPQTVLRWLSQHNLRVLWKREGNTMPRCRSTFCLTHAPAGWGHPQETHTNTPEPTHQQAHLKSFTRSHMAARICEIRAATNINTKYQAYRGARGTGHTKRKRVSGSRLVNHKFLEKEQKKIPTALDLLPLTTQALKDFHIPEV